MSSQSPERAGFLDAIFADPDDDLPRLVYADWLDDQGETERADFIRSQCRLARFCSPGLVESEFGLEAGQLVPSFRQAFLKPFLALGLVEATCQYHDGSDWGFNYIFRRGFVDEIIVYGERAARVLLAQARQVFASTPLLHLRFRAYRMDSIVREDREDLYDPLHLPFLAKFLRLPPVRRLRTLDLRGHNLPDELASVLLGSPSLGPTTNLLLGGNNIGPASRNALGERFGFSVTYLVEGPGGRHDAWDDDIPF